MSTRSTIYCSDDGNLHVYTDKCDNGDYCVELHAVNEAVSATVSLSIAAVKALAKWWSAEVEYRQDAANQYDEIIPLQAASRAVALAGEPWEYIRQGERAVLGLPDDFDLTDTEAVKAAYQRHLFARRADARKWIETHAPELVAWEVTK